MRRRCEYWDSWDGASAVTKLPMFEVIPLEGVTLTRSVDSRPCERRPGCAGDTLRPFGTSAEPLGVRTSRIFASCPGMTCSGLGTSSRTCLPRLESTACILFSEGYWSNDCGLAKTCHTPRARLFVSSRRSEMCQPPGIRAAWEKGSNEKRAPEEFHIPDPKDANTPDRWVKRNPALVRLTGTHRRPRGMQIFSRRRDRVGLARSRAPRRCGHTKKKPDPREKIERGALFRLAGERTARVASALARLVGGRRGHLPRSVDRATGE